MNKIAQYLKENPVRALLVLIPVVIVGELLHWNPLVIFALASLSIIPLAGLIGESTESLAHYTGPKLGGLLNATLGNAAELIITIVAIREGLLDLVKASITGSIIGNLLLVMGMSMLLGGLKHGTQKFDRRQASNNSILLVLTILLLTIPSLLSHNIGHVEPPDPRVEALSLGVAAVMIILYALGLIYSFKKADHGPLTPEPPAEPIVHKAWPLRTALVILALSTAGVALLSEFLVGAVDPVVEKLGISEFFIGVIFIPIIGNVAEHLVAVQVAVKNQMTLSVEIAVASSLQIALFVAPALVFISLLFGHYLTLAFDTIELIVLIAGVLIAALVSEDGESNWLEGAELLAIYIVIGLAFFLLPR